MFVIRSLIEPPHVEHVMEDGRSGLDLTAAVWSRGGERERRRLLAAAALGAHVRERGGRQESHVDGP